MNNGMSKFFYLMYSWQVGFLLAKKVLLKLQGSRAIPNKIEG
jgi:cytosine/uracil/thiamine/allantoin permease